MLQHPRYPTWWQGNDSRWRFWQLLARAARWPDMSRLFPLLIRRCPHWNLITVHALLLLHFNTPSTSTWGPHLYTEVGLWEGRHVPPATPPGHIHLCASKHIHLCACKHIHLCASKHIHLCACTRVHINTFCTVMVNHIHIYQGVHMHKHLNIIYFQTFAQHLHIPATVHWLSTWREVRMHW